MVSLGHEYGFADVGKDEYIESDIERVNALDGIALVVVDFVEVNLLKVGFE